MGLMYTALGAGEAIAAAGDMMEVITPSDAAVVLHRIWVEQETEAGDAQSEQVKVTLSRITVSPTSGSGGTTVTPRPMISGGPAAGTAIEANNTTDLTGGTSVDILTRSFNVMNGMEVVFTPEERPEAAPSTRFLLKLDNSPNDSITFNYGITFEEVGG